MASKRQTQTMPCAHALHKTFLPEGADPLGDFSKISGPAGNLESLLGEMPVESTVLLEKSAARFLLRLIPTLEFLQTFTWLREIWPEEVVSKNTGREEGAACQRRAGFLAGAA
jgi:hypothetical protein